jgi:hypothetical protein
MLLSGSISVPNATVGSCEISSFGFWYHLYKILRTSYNGKNYATVPCSNQGNAESKSRHCHECLEIVPAGYPEIDTHTAVADIATISNQCEIVRLTTRKMGDS